ncbi:MAG TPA: ABC transporter ATP-binding protein [Kofleriaceae bacterium]|jgi:ABC-2 type transport system ATP-binding protein
MTAVLSLRGLGKDYGTRTAVRAIDLDVERGECLGLLGPNGAGKTTTISMACGVLTPTRGTALIGGVDLRKEPNVAKRKLGLVPQDLAVYEELTAKQNLQYFGALYGLRDEARIAWALGVVGLAERAGDLVKTYSGGMKRRLNIAAGIIHKPELLILDEPTVGVDPQSRNHIFETVKQLRGEGMTVVYTSHYMEEVELLCDRVAIVDHGEVVALGSIQELVAAHAGKGIELELVGTPEVVEAAVAAATAHGAVVREDARKELLRIVPTAGLGPVLAAIEGTGAAVARIESRQANLETAFLALTGRGLRDAA